MRKFARVEIYVEVEVIEEAFTPEFFQEFCENFFYANRIDDHVEYISNLLAREVIRGFDDFDVYNKKQFVEGYGEIGKFFTKLKVVDTLVEVN